jgi:hypothetical protein
VPLSRIFVAGWTNKGGTSIRHAFVVRRPGHRRALKPRLDSRRQIERVLPHNSKYPPAKPGALKCWPRKAAGQVASLSRSQPSLSVIVSRKL